MRREQKAAPTPAMTSPATDRDSHDRRLVCSQHTIDRNVTSPFCDVSTDASTTDQRIRPCDRHTLKTFCALLAVMLCSLLTEQNAHAKIRTYSANVHVTNKSTIAVKLQYGWYGGRWSEMWLQPGTTCRFSIRKHPDNNAPWFLLGVYDSANKLKRNYHVAATHSHLLMEQRGGPYTLVTIVGGKRCVWARTGNGVYVGHWKCYGRGRDSICGWWRRCN